MKRFHVLLENFIRSGMGLYKFKTLTILK